MSELRPQRFGRYLLIDKIKSGGMAEVYLAKASGVHGFEKILAIKRLLSLVVEDVDFQTMFIDEAQISARLSHANIAQVFEFGESEGQYFIAMEYIAGQDLRSIREHLQAAGEVMPVPMALYLLGRICQGLDYAHRQKGPDGRSMKIIHRDVSPPNVLVSYDGDVKLIDFGIAKAAMRATRTRAGKLKGKFSYMSPEQIEGRELDHRSDIFAAGIVFYELLTNQRPFEGATQLETLNLARKFDPAPPSTINAKVPLEIDRIVMKALAKDRARRYGWASELRADIERHIARAGVLFDNHALADWMAGRFATEIERERELMRRAAALDAGAPPLAAAGLDDVDDEPTRLDDGDPGMPQITGPLPAARSSTVRLAQEEEPAAVRPSLRPLPSPPLPFPPLPSSSGGAEQAWAGDQTDVSPEDEMSASRRAADEATGQHQIELSDTRGGGMAGMAGGSTGRPPAAAREDEPYGEDGATMPWDSSAELEIDPRESIPMVLGPQEERSHGRLSVMPTMSSDEAQALHGQLLGRGIGNLAADDAAEGEEDDGEPTRIDAPPAGMHAAVVPDAGHVISPQEAGSAVVGGALDVDSDPELAPAVNMASVVETVARDPKARRARGGLGERVRDTFAMLTSTQVIVLGAAMTLALVGLVALVVSAIWGGADETATPPTGSVVVSSVPPAACSVAIDGKRKRLLAAGGSLSLTGLSAGVHHVGLNCAGFKVYARTIEVGATKVTFVEARLEKE